MKEKDLDKFLILNKDNNFTLTNKKFENEEFSIINLSGNGNQSVILKNVIFNNCKVSPASCVISAGVSLEHVVFSELSCGDALQMSSEVNFNNVSIQGKKHPKSLWIKPQSENFIMPNTEELPEICLDISEYDGEVNITGLPAKNVVINATKQMVINVDKFKEVAWKELGLSKLSYWGILLQTVKSSKSTEGIFSFPKKSNKKYEKIMNEFEILKSHGCI